LSLPRVGQFVEAKGQSVGIAKLVSVAAGMGEVELFHSMARQERRTIAMAHLRATRPEPGTRCYMHRNGSWTMGRIARWNDEELEFRGPDFAGWVSEMAVFVRAGGSREDPLNVLLQHGQETPLFHTGRSRFMAELLQQRAVCRGMTGALSAGIDFYEHQVGAAMRVLTDPVQRYLLADEVGLGKTIEAGMVIRQFLLDEPVGRCLVLTPGSLVDQWREELESKFRISEHAQRVRVLPVDGAVSPDIPAMLVVDEAHQVAAGAFSPSQDSRRRFDEVAHLARSAERVLLLSATPLLHHERDYLAMLHLLDPAAYPLDGFDRFAARLRDRRTIGQLMLTLQDDAPAVVLQIAAGQLADACPGDMRLADLCKQLQGVAEREDVNDIGNALRNVRAHVGEVHRLYRRMIRHRRVDVEHSLVHARLVRESEDLGDDADLDEYARVAEFDVDDEAATLSDAIEQWRQAALDRALRGDPKEQEGIVTVYSALLECAAGGERALEQFAAARNRRSATPELALFLGPKLSTALTEVSRIEGESEILKCAVECREPGARAQLAAEVAAKALQRLRRLGRPEKVVVFAGFAPLAQEIAELLRGRFGLAAVAELRFGMASGACGEHVRRFRSEADCLVMVCDRTGEEGHNLQAGACIVHADLPWSPGRIEQRMGRADRIGQGEELEVKLLVGVEDGPLDAWAWVLLNGFGVFHQSIASTQLFAESESRRLADLMFREGPVRVRAEVDIVRKGVQDELLRVEEQSILDRQDSGAFSDAFAALERDIGRSDAIREATETWMCTTLRAQAEWSGADVVKYNFTRSLLPSQLQLRCHVAASRPLTYSRRAACQEPNPRLLRLGDPLISTLHEEVLADDRGQVFAMWRQLSGWSSEPGQEWLGFRFDFAIEADAVPVVESLRRSVDLRVSANAVQRLLDGLFPPRIEAMLVNSAGAPVEDPRLREALLRDYCKLSKGGSDVNLDAERRHILEGVVGAQNWPNMCQQARREAERLVREDPKLLLECQDRFVRACRLHAERLAAVRVRASGTVGTHGDVDLEERLSNLVPVAVLQPNVRLDAVGFFIVSGRPPEGWRVDE
jgi:ATP-dependent helicase HepA